MTRTATASRPCRPGIVSGLLPLVLVGCQMLPDSAVDRVEANRMSCGDSTLMFNQTGEGLVLDVDGTKYELEQVESISGSEYVAAEDPDTEFWTRGERAKVTLDGEELPECSYESGPTLAGTVWHVRMLDGERVLTNYQASMHFRREGRVGGRSSCNHYTANWERLGGQVVIERVTTTKMACPTEVMEQEEHFLGALTRVTGFDRSEEGDLLLLDSEGNTLIRAELQERGGNGE